MVSVSVNSRHVEVTFVHWDLLYSPYITLAVIICAIFVRAKSAIETKINGLF